MSEETKCFTPETRAGAEADEGRVPLQVNAAKISSHRLCVSWGKSVTAVMEIIS
jgi:hypothetical protein